MEGSGSSAIDVSPDWYVCYDCQKKKAKTVRIACKTTLVFTPAHICIQWIEELRKHVQAGASDTHVITGNYCEGRVNGVRYLFYPGCGVLMKGIISGSGRTERRGRVVVNNRMPLLLHPEFLAQFDIVFVQYETFLRDYQVYVAERRQLRRQPRFPSMTSPLFQLQWWRIVFDEMQLVESNMEALARCNTLDCVNMWCVSGTPFNRNLQDLFGVVRLLRLPYYGDRDMWTKCIAVRAVGRDDA